MWTALTILPCRACRLGLTLLTGEVTGSLVKASFRATISMAPRSTRKKWAPAQHALPVQTDDLARERGDEHDIVARSRVSKGRTLPG